MDPYLEDPAYWEGFHALFIVECVYQLSERLPENYVADVGERVHLVNIADEVAAEYLPDVAISRRDRPTPRQQSKAGSVATLEPVTIPSIEGIEVRETFVQIHRLPQRTLVTAIELLSPTNKFGEGIGEYRANRRELVAQGVNVVEIDLLRRGQRTQLAQELPVGDYYAFVFRRDRAPQVDVYAWAIQRELPTIAVPLRAPDADVPLDLAAIVATAYDRGKYARKLQYDRPLAPPLSADDAQWAQQRVKSKADS